MLGIYGSQGLYVKKCNYNYLEIVIVINIPLDKAVPIYRIQGRKSELKVISHTIFKLLIFKYLELLNAQQGSSHRGGEEMLVLGGEKDPETKDEKCFSSITQP